jgi:zinc protease
MIVCLPAVGAVNEPPLSEEDVLFRPLLLAGVLLALTATAAEPEIKFEKYQLPNGLTVILSQDHRLPQVAVDLWYHVGAANQSPGKSGFAHLFEHMMFSGAKHIGPAPFKILEGIGTTAGAMANGTTSFDRTNYFEVVSSDQVPTALWLESDRMGYLLHTLDEQKLAIQRKVVSNERRQSYENRPYGASQLKLCDLMYPAPHPYYDCVIGTLSEIAGASMEDLQSFFRKYYSPANASLVLVGDFEPAQVKPMIEKYFGSLPSAEKPAKPNVPQPMLTKEIKETVKDASAQLPAITIAWNGVKPYSPDEPAGDVLAYALGGSKTSRLYRLLVLEKQVASDVSASDTALGLGGYFSIDVVANPGHTLEEIQPLIQQVIDDVKKNGLTPDEVDRAKRNILADFLRGVERIGGFGGKADLLNNYEMWVGDPGYLPKDIARYHAVTAEQSKAFAEKYLPDDKRLILFDEPANKQADAR